MEFDIERLWALTEQVWREGLFGVDIGRILTALGIFIAFLILRRIFARIVLARIRALTEKTETTFDDALLGVLEGPLRIVPVVVGAFFAIDHLALDGAPAEVADNIVRSLVAFAIFWALFRAVTPLSILFQPLGRIVAPAMVDWLVKLLKGFVALIGAATVLEMWGIEVAPIIAGFGLFGVAVALGAQDLFKNLIAGLLILAERRFSVGHWVKVDGVVEGTVEKIGFRSTLIRRFDKAPVMVPNTQLSDNAVTNFSLMTYRRIYWVIGLEYRSTIEQLRTVRDGIEAYIEGNDDFVKPPDAARFIRVDSFNDSSIDVMVYCFTKTTVWGEWLEIKEAFALKVKAIVEAAGTSFAFPSTSLYVETLPEDRPEVFTPPSS